MRTRAVRLYGANDLRLEYFELPEIKEDEILARVETDSMCMSTYKAVSRGVKHKRVPRDIAEKPVIIGHEFSGVIEKVGKAWRHMFSEGQRFAIQPALNYKGSVYAPGYSYPYFGGNATYIIIPREVMELGFLLDHGGRAFYEASLAEPMSCIISGFHSNYHTEDGSHIHHMGIKPGGNMALLAGAGPMGLGAIDYALHCRCRPGLLVVTDRDAVRLARAARLFTPVHAKKMGVELHYVDAGLLDNVDECLEALTKGRGYDDVFIYAPVRELAEQADRILGKDGCINFFAGPTDAGLKAAVNFYNVHYSATHILGSTGGNAADMREALEMAAKGLVNPAVMITHVGGLNCVPDTILSLPQTPGGKKLIYNHLDMPLTAISEFEERGKKDMFFAELDQIVKKSGGLWSKEAEEYLISYGKRI